MVSHLTDEDLLLDFYGESDPAERVRVHTHLASCAACRDLDRELRSVLALVDAAPLAEAPAGFERVMWARVEPQVTRPKSERWSWLSMRPLALAGGVAVLMIGAFFVGRLSYSPAPSVSRDQIVDAGDVRTRLLRSEVGDHLDRSQRVLVELVNADASDGGVISAERERAADLVAYGRLYQRSVEETGDTGLIDLLEDLERVLIEVANGTPDTSGRQFNDVRARIDQEDLVFRVRVVSEELRERGALDDARRRGTRVIW